ncbi:MAG: FtsX-like permease family protein [Lachnospiraceae bacterium]|nr:FtsX-like permease family protein [Lachnospiraceae bacterium]
MTSYMMLAIRYFQQNRRRSLITVIGAAITVLVLYTGLNLTYSFLLHTREAEREKQDYEFVLFTEAQTEIEEILKDSRIKSAYVGSYYERHTETVYSNALYINTTNPYRMNTVLNDLEETYGISGEYNNTLASLYMQGPDGSFVVVIILFTILVCYIFAIFGVGIVRNAIQLSMLENIRDYGNLRCIGSSSHQLKQIVFLQGLIMEGIGIILGSILGTIASMIIGVALNRLGIINMHAGFHLLPFFVIAVVFIFDLFFIMGENVKLVSRMSPIAAIRGEYEIKAPKIKERKQNVLQPLIQKLLGIDGEYALKNVLRNPRRFGRTIVTLVFGITAFMGIVSIAQSFAVMEKKKFEEYKYYQLYFENVLEKDETIEMVETSLPSVKILAELSDLEEITDVKRMYSAESYTSSPEVVYSHMSEEFLATDTGQGVESLYAASQKEEPSSLILSTLQGVACYGYDEADIMRYQPVLVDGTLEVSSQGIILVNRVRTENSYEDVVTGTDLYETVHVAYTDYKVGDTIELLDIGELHRRLDDSLEELEEEFHNAVWELNQNSVDYEQMIKELKDEYSEKKELLVAECEEQLAEEGLYKTYTIEGIVSEDVNLSERSYTDEILRVIMPLDTYFDLTGTKETEPTGMMFRVKGNSLGSRQLERIVSEINQTNMESAGDSGMRSVFDSSCDISEYMNLLQEIKSITGILAGAFMVVLFILLMFALNTVNTTASNLYLRRKEFAQLRVIGISKRRLMRIVMLEGIMEALIADVLGIVFGTGLCYGLFRVLDVMIPFYRYEFSFPYGMAVVGVLLSVLLLCGSIYFPLKGLGNDLADGLKADG